LFKVAALKERVVHFETFGHSLTIFVGRHSLYMIEELFDARVFGDVYKTVFWKVIIYSVTLPVIDGQATGMDCIPNLLCAIMIIVGVLHTEVKAIGPQQLDLSAMPIALPRVLLGNAARPVPSIDIYDVAVMARQCDLLPKSA
jgi:hypothetical protein